MITRERLVPFVFLLAMAIVICDLWRSEVAVQTQGPEAKPVSVASQTNRNSAPAVPASPSFAQRP